jgi:hypothetical protein
LFSVGTCHSWTERSEDGSEREKRHMKTFKLVLFLFLAATVVCTLLGYAVLAQPVQAGGPGPTVKNSVDLRVELPWSKGDGSGALTVPLWHDPGS